MPRRSPTSSSRRATATSSALADLGTLVEREREPELDLARRRRAVDLVPGLQAAGRQHRRDRRGDQGGRRGAEEDAAARRRAAPGLRRQRLGRALALGRQEDADRRRAADDRDRLPVPAQLAQHDHHRADAADRRDLGVHRRLHVRLHAQLHDDDGAVAVHRPAHRRRHRRAREHRPPRPHGHAAIARRRRSAPTRSAWR